MKTNKTKKGFTLVELVIVIAVIAILAAVLIPTFTVVIKNSKESAAMQNATNAKTALLTIVDPAKLDTVDGAVFAVDGYSYTYKNGAISKTVEDDLKTVKINNKYKQYDKKTEGYSDLGSVVVYMIDSEGTLKLTLSGTAVSSATYSAS